MRPSTLGIAIAALVAPFASASAQTPVPAGILECQGGQNVGFVVGSVTQLECVFRSEGRPPEGYIATVRRIGVDLGFTQQTQFSWAVSAPSMRLGRGALAGSYGGVASTRRWASDSAATFWLAARAMPMACSPSACKARPV